METWIWIAVAVMAVVLLLRFAGRRAVRGRVDPTDLLLEPALVDEVRALAQADQKTAAIALLRKRTPGLGVGPAKVIVDRMAVPKQAPPTAGPAAADAGPVPLEVELDVRTLKSGGDLTAAIELVREHTGWDRSTATSYVEGL